VVAAALVPVISGPGAGVASAQTPRSAPSAATAGPTTLTYTGAQQTYTVPSGVVLLSIAAIGAAGGGTTGEGGSGMDLTAQVPVTPNETLYTEVGSPGASGGIATFGGGGAAGSTASGATTMGAGSGGGSTDVRTCSETANSCPGGGTSLGSRLIVAGGGGGAGGQGSSLTTVCGFSQSGGNAGSGNGSGGTEDTTSAGTVILGSPDATTSPSTPAGGGSASGGTAGPSADNCGTGTPSYSGSVAGSTGAAGDGGSGGTGVSTTGGGGGAGGGYFGGGGGASGPQGCIMSTCSSDYDGEGGGGGSSFVASSATLVPGFGTSSLAASVTFTPLIEIDAPADGAVYTTGQTVDASWSCDTPTVTNCTGTTPSGQAVQTSPCGAYSYSVTGTDMDQPVSGTVDYRVGLDVTTTSLPGATIGQAFRQILQAACGTTPYSWKRTSGKLPGGIKLHANGTLGGIPRKSDKPGSYTFAVRVKDSESPAQIADQVLTINLSS
jgi:hypothetical protein